MLFNATSWVSTLWSRKQLFIFLCSFCSKMAAFHRRLYSPSTTTGLLFSQSAAMQRLITGIPVRSPSIKGLSVFRSVCHPSSSIRWLLWSGFSCILLDSERCQNTTFCKVGKLKWKTWTLCGRRLDLAVGYERLKQCPVFPSVVWR